MSFSVNKQRENRQRRVIFSTITFSIIRIGVLRDIRRNHVTVNRTIPAILPIIPIIPIMRRMIIRRDHAGREPRVRIMPRVYTVHRPGNRTHRACKVLRYNSVTILVTTAFSLRILVFSSFATVLNSRTLGLHSDRRTSRNFILPIQTNSIRSV